MAQARFSIGIDLGTTNCALAFAPLDGGAGSEVFAVSQWDAPAVVTESLTLPSFLYLPEETQFERLFAAKASEGGWVAGRLARAKAAETPGRVAHSAKSWLIHHAADRTAPFLPWGSEEIEREKKISPVRAEALLLRRMRDAWNERFATSGAGFDAQVVTVTVPASFDSAAQHLTLAAAHEAGFPEGVRLLEEPQAAFYRWLERRERPSFAPRDLFGEDGEIRHALVVDIGGGTSDFSLFCVAEADEGLGIERIAVSDHILLGGDNMDLALAHRLEPQLVEEGEGLSGPRWAFLVARCRDLKERVLSVEGSPHETFSVSIPGRGSSLIAGARSAQIARFELESLLLEGFFPECDAEEVPLRTRAALGEWGLPYAADPGVTRHLADFLRGRPAVDAVLFNGGALHPRALRERICDQIGVWQRRPAPLVLDNPEPEFAVARGAARFGWILHSRARRIEARSARAIFLEAHRASRADGGERGERSLLCILPKDAASEQTFEVREGRLELRVNRPVRFRAFSSTRHDADRAGDVVAWNADEFQALPPLETVANVREGVGATAPATVPVSLNAKLNELGLLQISCVSEDPAIRQAWPLEFDLRLLGGNETALTAQPAAYEPTTETGAGVERRVLKAARERMDSLFRQPLNKRDKLTATRLLKSLEGILGAPKGDWNVALVRSLWPTLESCEACRRTSLEHEEAWLIVAGFLLRPGFGAALDELRIDSLWRIVGGGLRFPTKGVKLQEYILWRRVAGGLSAERQERILAVERARLLEQENPPPELVLLAGSLERVDRQTKTELIERFIVLASARAAEMKHNAHFFAALGLLLNRTPLYAGPETVVAADLVERAYDAFAKLDWGQLELQVMFLRAARVSGNRALDLPKALRNRIADNLERAGVAPSRTGVLREYVLLERADRISLFGESLPPGLILREG